MFHKVGTLCLGVVKTLCLFTDILSLTVVNSIDSRSVHMAKTTPRMDPETLGQRIKRLRTAAGLTQAQLAQQVGVESVTVSRWETGASRPRNMTLWRALAASLEVFVDEVRVGYVPGRYSGPERRQALLAPLRDAVAQAMNDPAYEALIAAAVAVLRSRGWRSAETR